MRKKNRTERQTECYAFIVCYMKNNRKPPTIREIADGLGCTSSNSASQLLGALESKGWLKREPENQSRNIVLL